MSRTERNSLNIVNPVFHTSDGGDNSDLGRYCAEFITLGLECEWKTALRPLRMKEGVPAPVSRMAIAEA